MNDSVSGPDLTKGVPVSSIADSAMLAGHAHGEPVLLVRRGNEFFAIGGTCTHWGAPLADGLLVGDAVRCPWHHACFNIRTGEALRAPALDPLPCWSVELRDDGVYVGARLDSVATPSLRSPTGHPASVVIVGGGAAGNAAAEMLRRLGYAGTITLLSADASVPCDRPTLSKGYLSGAEAVERVPLRSAAFYEARGIALKLNARVATIDTAHRHVELVDGTRHAYDALLLATGAEPVRLEVPGATLPHVHYLRTSADGDALVAAAHASKRAVVIGASFIGLEYLETSVKGIFAAGDIARWPDHRTGERLRIEHWVVAERQGQTAARNILGAREAFDAVPFFWTDQYDFSLAYVGHAEHWDVAELDGQLDADTQDCAITYRRGTTKLAVAVVHRDRQGLDAEIAFEKAN